MGQGVLRRRAPRVTPEPIDQPGRRGQQDRERFDPAGEGGARHGIAAPRGLVAHAESPEGRFTRMFGFLPRRDPGPKAVLALVERMRAAAAPPEIENITLPAGYTYLGQFIDHDVTYDATSKIDGHDDPRTLVNFRTPRLDLDSLYGSGPADQPFLYDWNPGDLRGLKLLVGHNPPDRGWADVDLPRNEQERALIPEARNDENLIVSQLHLLLIKFHNSVVRQLHGPPRKLTGNELFDEAHRTVRWHYQWIVMHDFLPRILGETLAQELLGAAAATSSWDGAPAIPIEFSAAAYRFGHSLVRRSYSMNSDVHVPPLKPPLILPDGRPPAPGMPERRHLGGFRRLPDTLEIDWHNFFGPTAVHTMAIDHRLAPELFSLPIDGASLPLLNMQRGGALGLPSGIDVALAMGERPLTEAELLPPADMGSPPFWPPDGSEERAAIVAMPPLWFYILREAGARGDGGAHLGRVGGRIVALVLRGLLEADPTSYLHAAPAWKPTLKPSDPGTPEERLFEMTDLVEYALRPDLHDQAGAQARARTRRPT